MSVAGGYSLVVSWFKLPFGVILMSYDCVCVYVCVYVCVCNGLVTASTTFVTDFAYVKYSELLFGCSGAYY